MKAKTAPQARLLASNPIPEWQIARAKLLHRACLRIQDAIAAGRPIQKTIRRTARRLDGRPLRCDLRRRIKCSPPTMRRLWDAWKSGMQNPEVLMLKYRGKRLNLSALPLLQFVDFIAARPHKSFAGAWRDFSKLPEALPLVQIASPDAIRRVVGMPAFRALQQHRRADASHLEQLAQLQATVKAALQSYPIENHPTSSSADHSPDAEASEGNRA